MSVVLSAVACTSVSLLSNTFPVGVPSAGALAGWETLSEQTPFEGQLFAYQLWVNPRWPGLYEVTRYRVFPKQSSRGREVAPEIFIWNAHHDGQPLLCYELVARPARTGEPGLIWQAIPPGTERYRSAMFGALRVYDLHRQRLGL